MSAHEHLSPEQFSYYRGLHLGFRDIDPGDEEAVLSRLRSHPDVDNPNRSRWPLYGPHWTGDRDTAQRFALDPSHGQRNYVRPVDSVQYGAVLEASSHVPHARSAYSLYESQTDFPHRDDISRVQMHLYRLDPGQRAHHAELLRSIEVPEKRWRNA